MLSNGGEGEPGVKWDLFRWWGAILVRHPSWNDCQKDSTIKSLLGACFT